MENYHQSKDFSSEEERLRLLSLTANQASRKALGEIATSGFSPSRILDAGCGTGDAFAVIKELFPNADLVGLDQSEKAVEAAKQRGLASSVIVGNILSVANTEALGDEFDLIIVRNTLLHIPAAKDALTQLSSILKDDGILMAQEPDWDTAAANWDDFAIFKKVMVEAMRSHGINPTMGQRLEQLFIDTGLSSIIKKVFEYRTKTDDEGWKVLEYLVEVSEKLIEPYLQAEGIDSAQEMLERFNKAQRKTGNYFDTPAWVVTTGRKHKSVQRI